MNKESVQFWIDGAPQWADRARATLILRRGAVPGIRMYDTKRAETWKRRVAFYAAKAMLKRERLEGALELTAIFHIVPNKRETREGCSYKRTKPDLSNYLKALEDGLEKTVFKNDSAIVRVVCEKVVATGKEGVDVLISIIEPIPTKSKRGKRGPGRGAQKPGP